MSNLNRTFCPAVKGAASLDTGVLGPRLNQPRWCLATPPRTPPHVPSSRSAWMGFGCQTPVTINSCQLGKACFSNGVGSGSPWGERWCGGRREAEGGREVGEQRARSAHRICLRGHRKASSRGEGSCWGGVVFLPSEGRVMPHGRRPGWGHLGAAPRGSRPPACPRFLGWTQGSGCRPPALCRSLRLSRRLMGPRPCRRSHRPLLQPPQHLHKACGEAPAVSSRAYPPAAHQPPWAPFPPSTGPGTTPHPHAHRGHAPGASGNRRSDAGLGGLPSCGTEAAAAHGVNQRGSRTSSGRGQGVWPEIHGLEGGAGRPR